MRADSAGILRTADRPGGRRGGLPPQGGRPRGGRRRGRRHPRPADRRGDPGAQRIGGRSLRPQRDPLHPGGQADRQGGGDDSAEDGAVAERVIGSIRAALNKT